jgi:hypothetical protein
MRTSGRNCAKMLAKVTCACHVDYAWQSRGLFTARRYSSLNNCS